MASTLSLAGGLISAIKATGLVEGRVYRENVPEPVPLDFAYAVVSDYISDAARVRGDDSDLVRERQLQVDFWQAYDDDAPATPDQSADELLAALSGVRAETSKGWITYEVAGVSRLDEPADRVSRHIYTIRAIYDA